MHWTLLLACLCLPLAGPPQDDARILTLKEALHRALTQNPARAAVQLGREIATADLAQQSVLPNPEIDLEVENFSGSGGFSGFDGAETALSLTQPLPLSGERGKRITVAREALNRVDHEIAAADIELTTAVLRAYTTALVSQERIGVRTELLRTAQEIARTVDLRVAAGKVAPLEAERARIDLVQARISLADAEAERDLAFRALAALWGGTGVDFESLAGEFRRPMGAETVAAAADHLAASPAMRALEAEERERNAEIELESARALPDFALTGGIRRHHELGDTAFIAGISIELPLLDRNRGAIAAASARARQTALMRAAAVSALQARFDLAVRDLRRAQERLALARSEILPAAERLLRDQRIGYEAGKFSQLELLDAQRTLNAAREQELDLLAACHVAAIEVLAAAAFPADPRLPEPDTYFSGADHE